MLPSAWFAYGAGLVITALALGFTHYFFRSAQLGFHAAYATGQVCVLLGQAVWLYQSQRWDILIAISLLAFLNVALMLLLNQPKSARLVTYGAGTACLLATDALYLISHGQLSYWFGLLSFAVAGGLVTVAAWGYDYYRNSKIIMSRDQHEHDQEG